MFECLQDNIVEAETTVDPKYHRHFVARRGEVLRQIADDYGGVIVSFPRSGVNSNKVLIKGSKDCVEAAKKKILDIVEDLVIFLFSSISYISFDNYFLKASYASESLT